MTTKPSESFTEHLVNNWINLPKEPFLSPSTLPQGTKDAFRHFITSKTHDTCKETELSPELREYFTKDYLAVQKKLKEEYGYDLETLGLPTTDELLACIAKLSQNTLDEIATFGVKRLLIKITGSLASKMAKVDGKKGGHATYFEVDSSDALWGPESTKASIVITDGSPEMPQLPKEALKKNGEEDTTWEERYNYLEKHYAQNGFEIISTDSQAMLNQLSLLDHGEPMVNADTVTVTNMKHLKDKSRMPCGHWLSRGSQFRFYWSYAEDKNEAFRSRPSVQVWSA